MGSQGIPQNVSLIIEGQPTIISGTADATGAQVLAANPARRWGVMVQNVDATATDTLKVGSVTGDCVILLGAMTNTTTTPNMLFVPGTGSIFLKSTNGTLGTDYVLMYL